MQKTTDFRRLEKYGEQGHGGGWITSYLMGRRIESTRNEGDFLVIRFNDQHEARIGWQDKSGNQITGCPFIYHRPWSHMESHRIDCMMVDGVWLIIQFVGGDYARIGWACRETKEQFKGEPFLENLDVRIDLVGASLSGAAGKAGR